MFSLDEFISKDFFDQSDQRTSKFFIELKINEVMTKIRNQQSNSDDLSNYPLTSIFAVDDENRPYEE